MFKAFVVVCVASTNQIYYNTCIQVNDTWGPYVTEEDCRIRSEEMVYQILYGEINTIIIEMYIKQYGLVPPMLYGDPNCEQVGDTAT
ncbi:MAG: hypothetical protein O3B87_05265 [bacterium]|nr:hypothetical protein [bacterium]